MCGTSLVGSGDPQKLIWIDAQGSLTHIVEIFNFADVSGPRATKWPKLNRLLKIVNYFTCVWHFSCRWYGPPEVDLNGYPRISNPYCHDIQIRRCEWTQSKKMTQSKSLIKNSKLFYMSAVLLLQVVWTPRSWFKWIPKDLLSHIAAIFKFGDVSGPRGKKWPKVNYRLKIVNYFTCMQYFSCRWYGSPELDLNGYPRISNPYCHDIQIRRC